MHQYSETLRCGINSYASASYRQAVPGISAESLRGRVVAALTHEPELQSKVWIAGILAVRLAQDGRGVFVVRNRLVGHLQAIEPIKEASDESVRNVRVFGINSVVRADRGEGGCEFDCFICGFGRFMVFDGFCSAEGRMLVCANFGRTL